MELKKVIVYNNYSVTSASMLSDYDRKILTLLYQPLCGYGALSLYLTLWCKHELMKNTSRVFSHKNLFNSMDCTVQEFEHFRNKLEGLGLLKSFIKEEETPLYCYELYSPLAPKEFFKHELLGTLIKQKLDEDDYSELKSIFMINKEKLNGYFDVSHTFNEVYNIDLSDTRSLKIIIEDKDELIHRKNGKIGSNFSLEIFLVLLKEKKIKKSLINAAFVELMESMANLYKLDEYALCNIVLASIEIVNNEERVSYETFKRKCFEYKRAYSIGDNEVKKIDSKKYGIDKKAEMLQELEPFQFLRVKQGNVEPSPQDIKLVEDLSLMSKLNPGVINVLLDYVMLNKQNTLPYNYVMKIASSLARENVKSAIEAMEYFNRYKTKYNNVKKEEKEESKPEGNIDEALELEKLKKARRERKNNATVEV